MSFTVIYNIPDTDETHFIGEYNILNPGLFIPKFLLLKMADYSYLKIKDKLEPVNLMTNLNYLIQGFKSIGFMNQMMDVKDIRDYIDRFLLNTSETDLNNLYNKMISPNEDGYTAFTVM
jgi:hypothetical protein